jgi:hypothetical protein
MARLDRAIHEKANEFSVALDGLVKPGHDKGGRRQFFHTRFRGNDVETVNSLNRWYRSNPEETPVYAVAYWIAAAAPHRRYAPASTGFTSTLTSTSCSPPPSSTPLTGLTSW